VKRKIDEKGRKERIKKGMKRENIAQEKRLQIRKEMFL